MKVKELKALLEGQDAESDAVLHDGVTNEVYHIGMLESIPVVGGRRSKPAVVIGFGDRPAAVQAYEFTNTHLLRRV